MKLTLPLTLALFGLSTMSIHAQTYTLAPTSCLGGGPVSCDEVQLLDAQGNIVGTIGGGIDISALPYDGPYALLSSAFIQGIPGTTPGWMVINKAGYEYTQTVLPPYKYNGHVYNFVVPASISGTMYQNEDQEITGSFAIQFGNYWISTGRYGPAVHYSVVSGTVKMNQ